jgi:hypothetical protein
MDLVMPLVNAYVVDDFLLPLVGMEGLGVQSPSTVAPYWAPPIADAGMLEYTPLRNVLVMWGFLYISTLIVYFIVATLTYVFFYDEKDTALAEGKIKKGQVWDEIFLSLWSGAIMTGMTAPIETAVCYGWGNVYSGLGDYGLVYLIVSPLLFVAFTDFLIYWIHRGLHHKLLCRCRATCSSNVHLCAFSAFCARLKSHRINTQLHTRQTGRFTSCTTSSRRRRRTRRSISTRSTASRRASPTTSSCSCSPSTTSSTQPVSASSVCGQSTSTIACRCASAASIARRTTPSTTRSSTSTTDSTLRSGTGTFALFSFVCCLCICTVLCLV